MKQPSRGTPWAAMLLAAALAACQCGAAVAQRVQFPTMVEPGPGAQTFSAAPAPTYTPYSGGPITTTPPSSFPAYGTPPPAFGATPAPVYSAAPTPAGAPGLAPGWDPYGAPGGAAPYSAVAPSPYAPAPQPVYPGGQPSVVGDGSFFSSLGQPLRFFQQLRLQDTWLLGDQEDLDVNNLELSGTFAFPFLYNQAPLLVTPGFAVNWFEGPVTGPPLFAELPPRTYDAFIDFSWQPQITPWLAANLGVRPGVYSDFEEFNTHSFRVMGRALAIFTFSPTVQIAAGVVYLDRLDTKLLPAGGIIYTPSPDRRYEILFPNPKLARHLTTVGTTDLWVYLAGEFGGGSWTFQRASGADEEIDYSDIRVILGIEGTGLRGFKTHLEVGYVFNREVLYRIGPPFDNFEPDDTVMLRAGFSY